MPTVALPSIASNVPLTNNLALKCAIDGTSGFLLNCDNVGLLTASTTYWVAFSVSYSSTDTNMNKLGQATFL